MKNLFFMKNDKRETGFENEEFIINSTSERKQKKYRNFGIDLFKMLATINVINLHINLHSRLIKLMPYSSKYISIWSLEILSYWAVNGYGLISGFVGYKNYKFSNLIYIWIEVFYYSFFFSVILFLTKQISKKELLYSLFPILIKRHWYVNAYFIMYLFLPFINNGIKILNKKIFRNSVIFFFFFFLL